jgi:hypothetical protein
MADEEQPVRFSGKAKANNEGKKEYVVSSAVYSMGLQVMM